MPRSSKRLSTAAPFRAESARRRERLVAIVASLPEAAAVAAGDRHLSLEVQGKRFGWYLEDHHGDGRRALHVKAGPGAQQALLAAAPDRFHVPAYLARHGWVGLWLDLPAVDWEEVTHLLTDAYGRTAPRSLVARLRGSQEQAPDAMSPGEFRSLALGLPGAIEGSHMDHPDFRVGGKIFASLGPDGDWGMVKLTPEQQALLVRDEPGVFAPFAGAWGRRGCTRVVLRTASRDSVRQALLAAWRNTAPPRLLREA
jgi:hypothetical protein